MISQLFMLKSALFGLQRRMQVISNNVSNAQTVGFKRSDVQFESLFPLILSKAVNETDDVAIGPERKVRRYIEYGQGVRISAVAKDLSQGTIEVTNQPLDMAIDGRGFLQFRLPDGRLAYSRAGNTQIDAEGNIVNPNGHPLEPAITIPQNVTEIVINQDGRFFVQVAGDPNLQEIGQIVLANFPNSEGLHGIGQNLYIETAASGEPQLEIAGENGMGNIRQRALEFSNVNIIEEMFDMLLTQRNFEVLVKAIGSGDAILKAGSDMTK